MSAVHRALRTAAAAAASAAAVVSLSAPSADASSWRIPHVPAPPLSSLQPVSLAGRSLDHHLLHSALSSVPGGLSDYRLHVDSTESPKHAVAEATLGAKLCGHPAFVHGGTIAALCDDVMGSLFVQSRGAKRSGFTASLKVNYRAPVRSGATVLVEASLGEETVSKSGAGKVLLTAQVRDSVSGAVYAEAEALFISPKAAPPGLLSKLLPVAKGLL